MKVKRFIACGLGVILTTGMCGTLSGCLKKGAEGVDKNKTQIYVGVYQGGFGTDYFEGLASRFMQAHPDYDAKYQIFPMYDKENDPVIASTIENGTGNQLYLWSTNNYISTIYKDKLEDLSDILTYKVDGENGGTIGDKLYNKAMYQQTYSKFGQGMYALPFAETILGLTYDHQVFLENEFYEFATANADGAALAAQGIQYTVSGNKLVFSSATDEVNYKVGDYILTAGQDGKYGTYDDGQPTTVAGFEAMLAKITGASMKAFISAGSLTVTDYTRSVLASLVAQYAGQKAFEAYYTLDSKGESVALQDGQSAVITKENGYLVDSMQAIADAYTFYNKYFDPKDESSAYLSHSAVTDTNTNNLNAQSMFLLGYRQSAKNPQSAFLVEGNWWEYEARGVFNDFNKMGEEERGYGKREYRYLLFPDLEGQKLDKAAFGSYTSGVFIVPKDENKDRLKVTKEFVAFMLSDESLRYFTSTTGSPMPYDYEMTAKDFEAMTPFAKNVYALYHDTKNVYIPNTSILRLSNPIRFAGGMGVDNAFSTADGSTPLLLVKTKTLSEILVGLKAQTTKHQDAWSGYLAEIERQGFTN